MFLKSGSVCVFRGCERSLIEPDEEGDGDAIIGEMAHIVADSRQGPRGDEPLDESERNKHTNLILVCPDHHTIIDKQPRTYSVAVLRQMKADHEERIATLAKKPVAKPKPQLKNERIQSTLLPITHLPQAVFAAPCAFLQTEEAEVKKRIAYPQRKNENAPYELCPFILRDDKLLAVHNLRQPGNSFTSVIDNNKVEMKRTKELWQKIPELYRQHATFATDDWEAYKGVIPATQHRVCAKGTGHTNIIERFNCTLRQRVSRLMRSALSFSKSSSNHIGAIKYFICHYNQEVAASITFSSAILGLDLQTIAPQELITNLA